MSNKIKIELDRWHRLVDNDLINNKYSLLYLFLATVTNDIKNELENIILKEINYENIIF